MENKDWQTAMTELVNMWTTSPVGSFTEIISNKYEPKPPTLKERILSIPYHFTYYLSYPFLWLAYQLWQGVEDAYLNSWDKE